MMATVPPAQGGKGDVSAHDLRMKLSAAEMMLEQELEMMSTEELKRLIDEGNMGKSYSVSYVDYNSDSEVLVDTADHFSTSNESPRATHENGTTTIQESMKKSELEEARDIITFVQTQGFEGIAEEEWDSDELDELEELKREIDRIQEELKFQRELKEFERRLRTMSTYELKVLVSRMEVRDTDRHRRRRGPTKERSATISNDGSDIASGPSSWDERENHFFDEMYDTLKVMLHQAIAERNSQKEIYGDDDDDDEDDLEPEQEMSDSDGDSSEGSGKKGKIKKSKKKRKEDGDGKRKRRGKRINSIIGSLILSKGRGEGRRKGSKIAESSDDSCEAVIEEGDATSGNWLKRKGSKIIRKNKDENKAERAKEKMKRKDSKGMEASILSMLPSFALGSRSKFPDMDNISVLARPTIFDDSILEGWLYRRKEKGMRKTWAKRWGVIKKGRFLLYDEKQKEKLEEFDLMFVKAQPGVAKVKRKGSAREPQPEVERPRRGSLADENHGSIIRQRSASLTSSTPPQTSSPRPPQRNDSVMGLVASNPSPSPSTRSNSQQGSPTSSSSSVTTVPDSPYAGRSTPSKPSSSNPLHFFELMTREETVRFLSPTARENEEWVEVINRERDTLVTCMLLAGDEEDTKKDHGSESGNEEGTEAVDGKLSIAESRRLLREIMEEYGDNKEEVRDVATEDKAKEAEQGSESPVSCEDQAQATKAMNKRHRISERDLRWCSNMYCADCGEHYPEWASINNGILICLECSGIHRSMGVHISQVRSTVLDRWRREDVDLIRTVGNRKFNELWKQRVERILEGPYGESFKACFPEAADHGYCHMRADAPAEQRRKFLRVKYAGDLASVLGVPRPCTIIVSNKKGE